MRLLTNQNAYTGNDITTVEGRNKYSYLGKRISISDIKKNAEYKDVKELNENGVRILAANVTYKRSKLWTATGHAFSNTATDNVYASPGATGIWKSVEAIYDSDENDVYKYGYSQGNSKPINVYSPI
jgi:hypothetical protein